jgi:hypothetical protein
MRNLIDILVIISSESVRKLKVILMMLLFISSLLVVDICAIISGTPVEPSFIYPWLVSIQIKGMHGCGGTLINPTTVVTAAHCLAPLIKKYFDNEQKSRKSMMMGNNMIGNNYIGNNMMPGMGLGNSMMPGMPGMGNNMMPGMGNNMMPGMPVMGNNMMPGMPVMGNNMMPVMGNNMMPGMGNNMMSGMPGMGNNMMHGMPGMGNNMMHGMPGMPGMGNNMMSRMPGMGNNMMAGIPGKFMMPGMANGGNMMAGMSNNIMGNNLMGNTFKGNNVMGNIKIGNNMKSGMKSSGMGNNAMPSMSERMGPFLAMMRAKMMGIPPSAGQTANTQSLSGDPSKSVKSIFGNSEEPISTKAAGIMSSLDCKVYGHRYNLNLPAQQEDAVTFELVDFIQHPKYKEYPDFTNDVAILKVKMISGKYETFPIVEMDFDGQYTKGGQNLTAAGWGMSQARGKMNTERMVEISAPVVDNNYCSSVYGELTKHPHIKLDGSKGHIPPPGFDSNVAMCAGNMQGKEGICQGDSGGPLFAFKDGDKSKPVLVGISSHGYGFECASKGVPDVYTRVSAPSVGDFIKSYIK